MFLDTLAIQDYSFRTEALTKQSHVSPTQPGLRFKELAVGQNFSIIFKILSKAISFLGCNVTVDGKRDKFSKV